MLSNPLIFLNATRSICIVNIQVWIKYCPALIFKFSFISVFNDGSTKELLSLTGTVPVNYRGTESTAFKKRLSFSNPQIYLAIQLYPDESFLYIGLFSQLNIFLFYRKCVQHSHLHVASRHISLQPSHLFCQTHKCHDDKNRETCWCQWKDLPPIPAWMETCECLFLLYIFECLFRRT